MGSVSPKTGDPFRDSSISLLDKRRAQNRAEVVYGSAFGAGARAPRPRRLCSAERECTRILLAASEAGGETCGAAPEGLAAPEGAGCRAAPRPGAGKRIRDFRGRRGAREERYLRAGDGGGDCGSGSRRGPSVLPAEPGRGRTGHEHGDFRRGPASEVHGLLSQIAERSHNL